MRTYARRVSSAKDMACCSTSPPRGRTRIQAQLAVGAAHDASEAEADRIADAVTSARFSGVARPTVASPSASVQRKCDRCEAEDNHDIQRTPEGSGAATVSVDPANAQRIHGMRDGGTPLADGDRRFFESRLGVDFSRVRIHADTAAAETARVLEAHAYTIGSHIAFARDRYAPETPAGRRLLAHELVHTVQQGEGYPGARIQRQPDTVPYEKKSEAIEHQYKLRGDSIRASAVAACRNDAAACGKLLTIKEVWALYTLAKDSKGDEAKIKAGLAGAAPTLAGAAPLLAPPLPASPPTPKFPPLRLVPPAPGPVPGPGVGPYVGPAIIVAILVTAGIQLWLFGKFQEELRKQGFIILEEPLGLCIGGCHLPAKRDAPKWDQIPGPKLPPITASDISKWLGPMKAPSNQPVPVPVPKDKSPREKCHEVNPSALACDYTLTDRDEVVQDFLLRQGFDMDALGDCAGFSSFGSGTIMACDGAPGEVWHCNVKGNNRPVSVFGCLCCDENGNTSYNWQGPHWSVKLGRR